MFLHGLYLLKCCVLVLLSVITLGESKYGFVTWSYGKAEVSVTDISAEIPVVHVARATYTNEINTTGWAYLELHTTPGVSDEKQAYAAGFLEGFLTRDLIWMHWQNVLKGICVMNFNQGCFSMNSNRLRGPFRLILDILEKQGYATVAFNVSEWLSSPAHERTPYLMREIGYKCGEIGLKLSAT